MPSRREARANRTAVDVLVANPRGRRRRDPSFPFARSGGADLRSSPSAAPAVLCGQRDSCRVEVENSFLGAERLRARGRADPALDVPRDSALIRPQTRLARVRGNTRGRIRRRCTERAPGRACRATQGRRRKQSDARRSAKGGLRARGRTRRYHDKSPCECRLEPRRVVERTLCGRSRPAITPPPRRAGIWVAAGLSSS